MPFGLPVVPDDQRMMAHSSQGLLASNSAGRGAWLSSDLAARAAMSVILESSTLPTERRCAYLRF